MTYRCYLSALAIAGALSLAACAVRQPLTEPVNFNAPWAQFRYNKFNNPSFAGNLRARWRIETDGAFSSSPAIVGQHLFLGNNAGTLYALDVRNGRIVWKHHVKSPLMSNPLVFDDLVIVGEGDQVIISRDARLIVGSGENALIAIDARNGSQRWRIPLTGSAMATPAIIHGYLVEHDGAGRITIADPKTGKVLDGNSSASNATMGRVLPLRGDRFATNGQNDNVIQAWSLSRSSPLWSTALNIINAGVGDCPFASDGSRIYCDYLGAFFANIPYQGGMPAAEYAYALDYKTGSILWNREMPERVAPPTPTARNKAAIPLVVGDTLFIGHPLAPYVHAIATEDGTLRWRLRVHGSVLGGIAFKNGLIYFGDLAGYLWAVDAKTGRPVGTKNMHSPFNVGSPVIVGKTLFIGCKTGAIIAIPLDEIRSARS